MNFYIELLLLFNVSITPLFGMFGNFGYEQTKVIAFICINTLVGFLWLLNKPNLKWSGIKIASVSFITILFISSITGIDYRNSFFGTEPYSQGLILYSQLLLFSLVVSTSKISLKLWSIAFSLSVFVVAFIAIRDWVLLTYLHQIVPSYAGRVVSTFGQPNFYAGFLILAIPLLFFLLTKSEKIWFWVNTTNILFISVAIIISSSRTGAVLLTVLVSIWVLSRLKKLWLIASVIFLFLIGFLIYVSYQLSVGVFWGEVYGLKLSDNPDLTRESVEKRPYIWSIGIEILKSRPYGYGLENINQAFTNYFTVNKHQIFEENLNISPVLISLKDLKIDRSHNYLLDLLLFSGFLGLMSWIWIVFLLLKKLLTSPANIEVSTLLISLVCYLIWIQFQNQSVVQLIYFWFLVGMIDSIKE